METSTGGEGLKCSNNNNNNENNNSNSNNSGNTNSNNSQPNGNNNSNNSNSNSNNNNNNNNNNVSSSMLKIRQFHSASPPLHHSLINGGHEQLTELTSSEISLDLQGLIDDSQFGDENLFGDLMDGKKNAVDLINNNTLSSSPYGPLHPHHVHGHGHGHGHGHPHHHQHQRTSPTNSLGGSSGVSSPGTGDPESSYYTNNSGGRHTLAYVPGSVHQASYAPIPNNNNTLNPHPINNSQQHDIRVKQEPAESPSEFAARQQAYSNGSSNNGSNNNNNNAPYSNGTVSSTTPSPPSHLYMGNGSPLKALSNPSGTTKYIHANISNNANSNSNSSLLPGLKKKTAIGERCSDEYRRRRERNNVAVRKSREKAKIRTRETEERVKILARENERLQKKVELLQEELSVLRSLFSNVGVLPDHIHRELSKHMDSFQAQHNAMAAGTI